MSRLAHRRILCRLLVVVLTMASGLGLSVVSTSIAATRAAASAPAGLTTPTYWTVASDGGVFSFGGAPFYGSEGGQPLNAPVVGMASTSDFGGYWLVASDGGIFTFGDAGFYGSEGNQVLNQPIVGMAATADGKGYWLVASDGGIFNFGDAGFSGSEGGQPLNAPIVGMAPTPNGGYLLVAADGGIFGFGITGSEYYGSEGGTPLNEPVVGMATTPGEAGYWLVASDGGIFNFGNAGFYGSEGGQPLNAPMVGIAGAVGSGVPTGFDDATSTNTPDWQCIREAESGDMYNNPAEPAGAYGIIESTAAEEGLAWPVSSDPPAAQDAAALDLYAKFGWSPWTTAAGCGL
jgi:hypothetical protein